LYFIAAKDMAEGGVTVDSDLPQPSLTKGRFQLPWNFHMPSFLSFCKFLTVEPDYSNIPAAEVIFFS
jgi:hypothetical protein